MPSTTTDRLNGLTTSVAVKAPCRVATTANITLSGTQTIDGVTVAALDRVLVKEQTSAIDNGIYIAATGNWTRAADFDGSFDVVGGTWVHVTSGTVNADTYWRVDGDGMKYPGTDSITFATTSGNLTLQDDLAASTGAGLVGFIADDASAVARTALDKMREAVSVKDFGATGDGTADDTAAIQAAIDHCRTLSALRANGIVDTGSPYFAKASALIFPPGVYLVTSSLWFGIDSGVVGWDSSNIVENVLGYGAVIKGQTNGKPVLDLAGAFGMKFAGLTVFGAATNSPNVGIFLARSGTATTNPSAGAHRFTDVNVHGDFTLACVYNYASEINAFNGCILYQNSGKYAYFGTNNNARHAVTSDHCTIATSEQSAYGDFFGNTFFKSSTANATPNGAVIWTESMDYGPKISGGYIDSSGAVTMPNIKFTNAQGYTGAETASYNQGCAITNCQFEYRDNQDLVVVDANHTVINLSIDGCSMPVNSGGGHYHLNVGGTVKNLAAQHGDGGTFGEPFLIGGSGEVYAQEAGVFSMRASLVGTGWQYVEGSLTLDGAFHTLDLAADYGIPTTAKFVAVKIAAKTTAAADAHSALLRAYNVANVAQYMEITPPVSNIAVQHEGLVPIVNGKIEYSVPSDFNYFRILLREYHL